MGNGGRHAVEIAIEGIELVIRVDGAKHTMTPVSVASRGLFKYRVTILLGKNLHLTLIWSIPPSCAWNTAGSASCWHSWIQFNGRFLPRRVFTLYKPRKSLQKEIFHFSALLDGEHWTHLHRRPRVFGSRGPRVPRLRLQHQDRRVGRPRGLWPRSPRCCQRHRLQKVLSDKIPRTVGFCEFHATFCSAAKTS